MTMFLIAVGALVVGFALGLAAEWPALRDWRQLARDQAEVLHTDERTPRHAPRAWFMAGPDDLEARNRIGGRR
jgi:hypothetical protein